MKSLTALPAALPAALAAAFAPVGTRLLKAPVAALMESPPRARRLMSVWAMPEVALARTTGMACNDKQLTEKSGYCCPSRAGMSLGFLRISSIHPL